jgi:hypothetical protein
MTQDLELTSVTWTGGSVDDPEVLEVLPESLGAVLAQVNGFILYGGALHVRGAVRVPWWHSLDAAWRGASCIASLYRTVQPSDIPFAQDCVGDQFLLRSDEVVQLFAESGEVEGRGVGLLEFLRAACRDPVQVLSPAPLERFLRDTGPLEPGRVLVAYPPLCTRESKQGVQLRAVPADDALRFHADFASQIGGLEDGKRIKITVLD